MKDHLILFFVLLTGKLYAIGMLYTLNSRVMLRERMRSTDLGRTSLAGTWQWDQADETARIFGPLSEVSFGHIWGVIHPKVRLHFDSPLKHLMRLQVCILPDQRQPGTIAAARLELTQPRYPMIIVMT
jgi:hypothetical protein